MKQIAPSFYSDVTGWSTTSNCQDDHLGGEFYRDHFWIFLPVVAQCLGCIKNHEGRKFWPARVTIHNSGRLLHWQKRRRTRVAHIRPRKDVFVPQFRWQSLRSADWNHNEAQLENEATELHGMAGAVFRETTFTIRTSFYHSWKWGRQWRFYRRQENKNRRIIRVAKTRTGKLTTFWNPLEFPKSIIITFYLRMWDEFYEVVTREPLTNGCTFWYSSCWLPLLVIRKKVCRQLDDGRGFPSDSPVRFVSIMKLTRILEFGVKRQWNQ